MAEDGRQRVAERIRALRRLRGLTQEALAEAAGFHPTYIQKVEAGRIAPTLAALARLARALHVPVASIVQAMDEPATKAPGPLMAAVEALLRSCSEEQLRFVLELIRFLQERPWASAPPATSRSRGDSDLPAAAAEPTPRYPSRRRRGSTR